MENMNRKPKRIISRGNYALSAIFLVYYVGHLEIGRTDHIGMLYFFYLIMAIIFSILWIISIIVRLANLGQRRLWIIFFILPYAAMIIAEYRGRTSEIVTASIFTLLVQLPLMLLPACDRAGSTSTGSK